MFKQRLPPTFFIGFWAIFIGSADRRARRGVLRLSSATGRSTGSCRSARSPRSRLPPLVLAVFLVYFVSDEVRFFPSATRTTSRRGRTRSSTSRTSSCPSLTLGLGLGAVWSRFLRADMITTLQSDFIMLARAKGMSPDGSCGAMPCAARSCSLITSVASADRAVSSVARSSPRQFFAMPGIGVRLVFAVQQNDLLVIQAITALLVAVVVLVNLAGRPALRRHRSSYPSRAGAGMTDACPHATVMAPPRRRSSRSGRRRPVAMWLGVAWLASIVFLAVFADYLPFIRGVRPTGRRTPAHYGFGPGADFWFGSDHLGRDVFARCIYGAQISLRVAVVSHHGRARSSAARSVSSPATSGAGPTASCRSSSTRCSPSRRSSSAILIDRPPRRALGDSDDFGVAHPELVGHPRARRCSSIAPLARIVRAQTLSLAQREYVLAARSLGAKQRPDHRPRDPAEPGAGDDVGGVHRPRRAARRRRRPRLPRLQRAAALTHVGPARQREPPADRAGVVGDDLPRAHVLLHGAVVQRHRRPVARRFDIREAAL